MTTSTHLPPPSPPNRNDTKTMTISTHLPHLPPSHQGLEYHHALRARGVPTKLLVYEQDVHAIDRPVSEADHWLQIGAWLEAHL